MNLIKEHSITQHNLSAQAAKEAAEKQVAILESQNQAGSQTNA